MKIAQPRDGEPIRLVLTATGEPRYRVRLDLGSEPSTGRRRQSQITFDSLSAARAHVEGHRVQRREYGGSLPTPARTTFAEASEAWLERRARKVRRHTAETYREALGPAIDAFGATPVVKVTEQHIESVLRAMTEAGRAATTVSLSRSLLRSIFDDALHEGVIRRSPAARVEASGRPPKERQALTGRELRRLRKHFETDPLYACWLLTLSGLRRSEVLGLVWSDVDFTRGTVSIERGRVAGRLAGSNVGATKTRRGTRVLPMPVETMDALRVLTKRQAAKLSTARIEGGYVALDAGGRPVQPEAWSADWSAACVAAKVRPVTLHAARHSSVTAMRDADVPDHVAAAYHGHTEAVLRASYTTAHESELAKAGEALSRALGANSRS